MVTETDIIRIVNGYIGVNGGYLGDFSYRTHKEFYPMYCDLDIDPKQFGKTTRERFIKVLQSQNSKNQAKILRGILEKYPLDLFKEDEQVTKRKHHKPIEELIKKLKGTPSVEVPELAITNKTVQKAIDDAKILIQKNGAISGVDRIHTTLHGYLKAICKKEGIVVYVKNPTINNFFKEIRKSPKFQIKCNRKQDVEQIINSMANIFNALNPIRNKASVVHPNEKLLDEAEARLMINSVQTLLHYLNSKFKD